MRVHLYIMLVSAMILGVAFPAVGQEPEDTVHQYMKAVKRGDVVGIKLYIGGKLLERRQILLEQNRKYPEFLRNRYDGMEHRVLGTSPGSSSTERLVEIELLFPDGTRSLSTLTLAQDQQGAWRVVNQSRESP